MMRRLSTGWVTSLPSSTHWFRMGAIEVMGSPLPKMRFSRTEKPTGAPVEHNRRDPETEDDVSQSLDIERISIIFLVHNCLQQSSPLRTSLASNWNDFNLLFFFSVFLSFFFSCSRRVSEMKGTPQNIYMKHYQSITIYEN